MTTTHAVAVTCDRGARYEWGAICICGWRSPRYIAEHAARAMADDHQEASCSTTTIAPA